MTRCYSTPSLNFNESTADGIVRFLNSLVHYYSDIFVLDRSVFVNNDSGFLDNGCRCSSDMMVEI